MALKKKKFAVFAALFAIMISNPAEATEWIVGDDQGWTINAVNYTDWARDKWFQVGDKLVFNYNAELHNVIKVNQNGYETCTVPPANQTLPVTGHNELTLATPGMKWYICGRFTHCVDYEQKLAIDVVGEGSWKGSSAPAPAPSSSNRLTFKAGYLFWILGSALGVFMVSF